MGVLKKLNEYIFKKRVAKFLKQSTRQKRFVDYKSAKTILLIFESDYVEKNRFIRKAISQLTSDGKKVYAWGFLRKKEISTAILPTFKILNQQQTDFTKQPKEFLLRELKDKTYDLLIDLTLQDVLPLQYVCLYANAAMKIGTSRTMDEVLDFVIGFPTPEKEESDDKKQLRNKENQPTFLDLNETIFHEKQQYVFEQIIFYLKNIQSKD